MIIGSKNEPVRFNYAKLWEPGETPNKDLKYSLCCLIDKKHTATIAALEDAIEKAIAKGIEKGKFTKAQTKAPGFKRGLRDGDAEIEAGNELGPEYVGMMYVNCSASENDAPGISKLGESGRVERVLNKDEVYSGIFGVVDANPYPFSNGGNRGVTFWLNNVLKLEDGERLDGKMSAEQAFEGFSVETGDDDLK